ncbi:MAG: T9SS type A sorting domain-containing protein [Ignavibacteria bacterium]
MRNKLLIVVLFLIFHAVCFSQQYGYKWVIKPTGTNSDLNCAYVTNTTPTGYGLICGSNGTMLYSGDGLNTWTQKNTGTTANLNNIIKVFNGYNNYLCCGDNGTLLFSTNLGNNWTQLNTGTTANLNCLASYPYSTTYRLFVVGDGGLILYSTWSGTNWNAFTQLPSSTTQNLNSITVNGNLDATICGNLGTVLKSTNGGLNWFQTTSPTSQNLNYINGYGGGFTVYGNNGVISYTSDTGHTWNQYSTGVTNNLFHSYSQFVSGSEGTVLLYDDWTRIPTPVTVNLNYIIYPYFLGGSGTILKYEIDSIKWQRKIDGNNLSTYQSFRGIFDQNKLTSNMAGFEWPIGSNKFMSFTTGLTASCMINGQLAQTSCSYLGEYMPGAIQNGQYYFDSSKFRIYKIVRALGASQYDWQTWGYMVPYGAPYVDVNHNGIYEPQIDTPGVRNASQTIFTCLTDINPSSHSPGEGYGGGITNPTMGIELHLTKWVYSYPSYNDVVFTKFEVLNKGNQPWNRTHFAIVSDPDVGNSADDWVGCDTVRNMGYGYNGNNNDATYGANPPAIGYKILKGPVNKSVSPNVTYNMTSFNRFISAGNPPPNEYDPNGEPQGAYILMQGFKKDSAAWLDRTQPTPWGSYKKTKKIFYGDPETNDGWTAAKGYIMNYGKDSVGTLANEFMQDMRFTLGMGADNYTVLSGDTAVITMAQFVARGTSNLNSVTKLKQLADVVQMYYESNFTIGIKQTSTEVPLVYSLNQNYPNPFNPITKIKFDIAKFPSFGGVPEGRGGLVTLKIYDITGREIQTLVNEKLQPGSYEVAFDGSAFSSGVYFYKLITDGYNETKKMVLLK